MNYPSLITTSRLSLQPLTQGDDAFIFELLNTEGWLQFIGNRNIATLEDARAYIQRINGNPLVRYWKVTLSEEGETIGVITFIQRDYLLYPDIGFAFLPRYAGKGYAREATAAVISAMRDENEIKNIVAVVLPHNAPSIRLLTALGFAFEKDIETDGQQLQLYRVTFPSSSIL